MKINTLIERQGPILWFCLISAFIVFSTRVSLPLVDTFHEGEYLGLLWHMRAYYTGLAEFPCLIHGAMDYIPSIIASLIYGDERIIVGTRLINTIICGVVWIFFLDVCYTIIPKSNQRTSWIIVAIFIFILFRPSLGSSALVVQQAFISVRDLFLLLSIWNFSKYSTSQKTELTYLIFGSFSAIAAIFWSYDRGMLSIVFTCIIFIGAIFNKKTIDSILLILCSLFGLMVLEYTKIFGSVSNNIGNIIYWIKNGTEIWQLPIEGGTLIVQILLSYSNEFFLILFSFAAISLVFLQRFGSGNGNRRMIYFISGLVIIQILLLKIVFNRPSPVRTLWGFWPSILLMLHFGPKLFTLPEVNFPINFDTNNLFRFTNTSISHIAYRWFLICLLTLLVIPIFILYNSFIINIFTPAIDVEIISEEINDVSKVLRDIDIECFFGWTNEGVIALMTKKRYCTKYPYAIYTSHNREFELLTQLKNESPKAIVIDSNKWSMNLDDKSMARRLPAIYQFILQNYPTKKSVGSYIIAIK
jgi:hypothetical protein